jgi:7,8-dihydroneopterin aldolase/epimerase/oxygenase
MDIIFIRELRAPAWIGIYEWEKLKPQTLDFELEIGLDTHKAGETDNIRHTIHYGEVVERIQADLKDQHFKLLEALAEHIAKVVLNDFKALWVKVSVAKIAHMRGVKMVGVTIFRKREGVEYTNADAPPPGFEDSFKS